MCVYVCVTAVLTSTEGKKPTLNDWLVLTNLEMYLLPASESNHIIQFDFHCRKDVRPEQLPVPDQPGDVLPASKSNQIIQFDVHCRKDVRPEQQASPV